MWAITKYNAETFKALTRETSDSPYAMENLCEVKTNKTKHKVVYIVPFVPERYKVSDSEYITCQLFSHWHMCMTPYSHS